MTGGQPPREQRAQAGPGMLGGEQEAAIEDARQQRQHIAHAQGRVAQEVAAQNHNRAEHRQRQPAPERPAQALLEQNQTAQADPDGRGVAQQGGVGRVGDEHTRIPGGQVAGEEQTGQHGQQHVPARQSSGRSCLAQCRQGQHRRRQRHPVEAGHRPRRARPAHEDGAHAQADDAQRQRQIQQPGSIGRLPMGDGRYGRRVRTDDGVFAVRGHGARV